MFLCFNRKIELGEYMMDNQWQKSRNKLIDVAMGRLEADLVINNGRWVSVQSGEIIKDTDIAVIDGMIAYVGPDAKHAIGDKTIIIDGANRFLVPGLLDGHMHVESTMLTITEFVRAVIPRGTTGIFIDPHEIANVFGLKGVRLMVDEAAQQPIHVLVQVPSCVPSAPGLETPGASIEPSDVAEALTWDGVIGLGEMMNFPGVFNGDEKMLAEMAETIKTGKTIGGHYASFDLGLPFHGYVAGGPEDDHEGTRLEDAIARIRQGMKVMMRYGSGWLDVATQIQAVTEKGLDSRHFILCTDDFHSETVVKEGHMDRVVRHAIDQGVDPLIAIQMATINTAEHFGVDREMGMIAPGRYADILLVDDLSDFQADVVISKGVVAAEKRVLVNEIPPYPYPEWATTSVKLGRSLTVEDFQIITDIATPAIANVIGVFENQAPTRHIRKEVEVADGRIAVNIEEDLAKVAVVDRHRGTGNVQVGLVTGFGFTQSCGLASTVAHDSHHMVVIGTNEADMAIAANELAKVGGGQIVVREGQVIGLVELPLAGLMSKEPAAIVASKAASVLEGFEKCGCKIKNPNMQMSLLALVVIPEIRLSDKGLVDVTKFDFIPLLEEKLDR
jgi:adenine deaminase